jgi:hypothetical protein
MDFTEDSGFAYIGTAIHGLWSAPLDQLPLSVRAEHQRASMPMEVYPNPARAKTMLHFELSERGEAHLEIFNVLGETVMLTDLGLLEAGSHDLPVGASWLLNGVYSIRISTDRSVSTSRLVLSH